MRDEFEKWRNALQDRPTDTTAWEFEIWKAGALAMRDKVVNETVARGFLAADEIDSISVD